MKRTILPQLLFLIVLCLNIGLHAQPTFDDYGKIDPAELLFSQEEEDLNADALILFDLGSVVFNQEVNRLKTTYRFHRRIKILNEEGIDWAKVTIPFNQRFNENVKVLKGVTYNLLENGEVQEIKLDKRTVTEEEPNSEQGYVRFPLPGARVGSVIEYVYQVTSDNIQSIKPWFFQQRIPVKYSEFTTYIPRRIKYVPVLRGDTRKLTRATGDYSEHVNRSNFLNNASGFGNGMNNVMLDGVIYGNINSYIMEDIAPLELEPYTTIPEDNMAQVSFQLASLRIPGSNRIYTWKMLSRELVRDKKFGRYMDDEKIQSMAQRMTSKDRRSRDKIRTLFEFVQERIEWNGIYDPYSSMELPDLLNQKIGNSADINLMLCAMLQAVKLDAYPILISTRDHGKAQMYFPDMTQFNHVIVGVKYRGDMIFLDALSRGVPFDMLPRKDLNENGFMVDKRNWGWIDIIPKHEIIRNTYTRFNLEEDGTLHGDLEMIFKEYSAATERGKLLNVSLEKAEYIRQEFLQGLPGATLLDFNIKNPPNIDSPVLIECQLTTPNYVQIVDDMMFVRPLLTKSIIENPFQSEERIAPIDLPCPIREYYLLGLEIPPGYELVQTPHPIRVLMPNNAGEFTFNVLVDESIIHVSSTIFIEKTHYLPEEYEEIKTFFDYIIRKHEEDLILRRIVPQKEGK